MEFQDNVIVISYLTAILAMGLFFSGKQKKLKEYFLADRRMNFIPVGLSVMTTAFSAINYTAFTGEVFGHGLYVLLSLPVFFIVAIPVIKIFLPFYYSMGLYSAYEYLEKRFDVSVRCLASGLFIIWRLFWMATLLYVPCKVLSVITGLNAPTLILTTGIIVSFYTAVGGMKAVMWSDVLQFVILFGSIVISVVIAVSGIRGGFSGLLHICAEGGRLKPFYPFDPSMFALDPNIRITLWSALIGTFIAFLTRYGADQVIIQRYLTAKSLKAAQNGFHLSYVLSVISLILLALMGLAIYATEQSNGALGSNGALPLIHFSRFVKSSLPTGITGLVVAGLFASTMSSLDSGINSCCTAFSKDFYLRFSKTHDNKNLVIFKIFSLMFGGIATLMALYIGNLGSVFEIANKIINGFGSPLLGIILMGMFSRHANSLGMFIGGFAGVILSAYVSFMVNELSLHYYALINLCGTIFFCAIFSLAVEKCFHITSKEQLSWMWRARKYHLP